MDLGRHRSEARPGRRHSGQVGEVFHNMYPGCQQLGMCRTLPTGLSIVDIDRVDADKNGARLDQVRRGITGQVRRTCGVGRVPKY
jgi:hypothetical protein